jgi:hypothetical protein
VPRTGQNRGKSFEYRVIRYARALGLPARRIVLSGSADEKLDVEVAGHRFECKYRSRGFVELRGWLEKTLHQGGLGVIVGGGRKEPFVVLRLSDLLRLLCDGGER